jgi:Arc/MetJ-type ribon-helix-helix transcriptional regulator
MDEPTTVGLTRHGHERLQQLKAAGFFADMADAYRFAIALGLAHGSMAGPATRETIFNVGTLDLDRSIHHAISALMTHETEAIYKLAERLAEWGVDEMCQQMERGELSLARLLKEAEEVGAAPEAAPPPDRE